MSTHKLNIFLCALLLIIKKPIIETAAIVDGIGKTLNADLINDHAKNTKSFKALDNYFIKFISLYLILQSIS